MDNTVGVYDAKTKLASLIGKVEKGETVTITRHGKPVARLVPAVDDAIPDRKALIENLKNFSKGHTLGNDLTIREMIDFGRK